MTPRFFQCVTMTTLALLSACANGLASEPLKVFILAGQSNMQGQAVVEMNHARKGDWAGQSLKGSRKDRLVAAQKSSCAMTVTRM